MKTSSVPEGRPDNIELEFYERAGMDAARYVSDATVREEVLDGGRFVGLYWSASGQVLREVGPGRGAHKMTLDPLIYPVEAFELEIDGQLLHNRWEWVGGYERDGARPGTVEAVVELRHQLRPVTVRVVTRVDGSPILVRWLEITNTASQPAALSYVSPISGLLWNIRPSWNPSVERVTVPFRLGYVRSEKRSEEGDFVWVDLPTESYRVERTQGTNYGQPYFVLQNQVTGELFFVGLAWSRNWFAEFTTKDCLSQSWALDRERDHTLSLRIGPLGPEPLRVIAPGETVNSPEVHLGPVHADFDEGVRAWYRHMRASVLPPRPEGKEMYTIAGQVIENPGDWVLTEIDIAAEMGVEAYMVDAGWYGDNFGGWTGQRGDWYAGDWLPGGLAGIREHAHSKGILFGLWMEPETASVKSNLYKEHPDWVATTDDGREIGRGDARTLNLGDPEVARFFEEAVVSVIRDHELDFFKIDYNMRVHEGGQTVRDGYAEQESWRHCEVLYGTFDRVRREMPQVALETCAGGGGRNDLGMLSRFHYACESDLSWFPLSIRAINGLSLFIPPEAICYYHNHVPHAHQTADLDTHLRVTLFANTIFVGFGAQDADRSTAYFQKTKRYIQLAKTFCYPIMAGQSVVHHHTPDIGVSAPADWCVLEYAAQDRARAYAGLFSLRRQKAVDTYVFRPRGLDPSGNYRVTTDNAKLAFEVSGRELANQGLTVPLGGGLTSELLLFESIEG
jgi:alpha-galactosidase